MRRALPAVLLLGLCLPPAGGAQAAPGKSDRLVERFLRYVQIDTQSAEDQPQTPSTAKQLNLARLLVDELKALGLRDAHMDAHGFVMATLPSNLPAAQAAKVPVLGLLSHMDTSPAVSGAGVKPQVFTYRGGDVSLSGNPKLALTVADNPELAKYVGQTIITTDGATLLGADNKAGIAEIMELLERLKENPGMQRGTLKIAFTVDEEIGAGIQKFDVAAFGAQYAYTVDGGTLGEIENETFNAATAIVTVTGLSMHPGAAKGKMVNSIRILADFLSRLPGDISPENTEKREGYLHPYVGALETGRSQAKLLIRDFDLDGLKEKEKWLERLRAEMAWKYPRATIELEIVPSYRNMRYELDKAPFLVDYAMEAARRAGLEPVLTQVRGGTDGAQLTARGLLTPNLFTGGENFHSEREWIPVPAMHKSVETLLELVKLWAEKSR